MAWRRPRNPPTMAVPAQYRRGPTWIDRGMARQRARRVRTRPAARRLPHPARQRICRAVAAPRHTSRRRRAGLAGLRDASCWARHRLRPGRRSLRAAPVVRGHARPDQQPGRAKGGGGDQRVVGVQYVRPLRSSRRGLRRLDRAIQSCHSPSRPVRLLPDRQPREQDGLRAARRGHRSTRRIPPGLGGWRDVANRRREGLVSCRLQPCPGGRGRGVVRARWLVGGRFCLWSSDQQRVPRTVSRRAR